jgi:hypothetical protein
VADTAFVAKVTRILAVWLNDINNAVYRAIGTGAGGVAPANPADVRTNLGLTGTGGAALIGNNPAGGSLGANVQAALDLKASSASIFANPIHRTNNWDDADTPNDASQQVTYTTGTTPLGVDHVGWAAYVHNQNGTNTDNIVALVGHGYHDGNFNNLTGAVWGIATEAWSNPTNETTLIGGELSVISQCAASATPAVGVNSVFKNRADNATNPTAPVIFGGRYNFNSTAYFASSQMRPSGAGAAWADVGSGWQSVLRIGDPGAPAMDWEGGSYYTPGSGAVGDLLRSFSTVINQTAAMKDMAGEWPWIWLTLHDTTFWGMRFCGLLTGALETCNLKVNAGGAGYAAGDTGTIVLAGGSNARYYVKTVAAGVVTEVQILQTYQGAGYTVGTATTTVLTGGGNGALTIDITLAIGRVYGFSLSVNAGGAGYAANDIVTLNGGTAGYVKPTIKVLTVSGGAVATFQLITNETLKRTDVVPMYSNGRGHTAGVGKTTTAVTGTGAGLTMNLLSTYDDLSVGGERWEFWRMLNPGNPTSSGARHKYIDASSPGSPATIDTSGATYTFPIDGPM